MTKVLVVVDMQKDFIDGSLGTKEAQAIVPTVVKEIENGNYDKVYATLDTHPDNYLETSEGRHLPVVHCVKGSEGWKLNPEVRKALDDKKAELVEKPTFGSVDLMEKIAADKPEEITLIGLCTDICVVSNALLLKAALHETPIKVIAKCCAGVTPATHEAALETMRSCQIEVV